MTSSKVPNSPRSNLPTVAERAFALLCGEEEVSCNRSSDEDNNGWDYIIQFDPDERDRRSRDEQRAGDTAFVQVKSTASAPFKVSLKLSNALRMAKQRHPFFLVLVVGRGASRRFFSRHFWADEIEHTLRRVRQAEVSGHRDLLHTKTLTVTFSENDDHTLDLLTWMSTTIKSVPGEYPSAKAKIAEHVGFNEEGTRIKASFSGPRDEILDWELGIGPSPQVTDFTMFRERFGIVLPDLSLEDNGVELPVTPVGQDCSIMLRHQEPQ